MSQYRQDPSMIMRSIVHMTDAARSGIMPPAQLTTINQSQLSAQLGLNLGGANVPHTSPSPPASKSATPSPSSSINEEDADEANRVSQRWPTVEPSGQLSQCLLILQITFMVPPFSSCIWRDLSIGGGSSFGVC